MWLVVSLSSPCVTAVPRVSFSLRSMEFPHNRVCCSACLCINVSALHHMLLTRTSAYFIALSVSIPHFQRGLFYVCAAGALRMQRRRRDCALATFQRVPDEPEPIEGPIAELVDLHTAAVNPRQRPCLVSCSFFLWQKGKLASIRAAHTRMLWPSLECKQRHSVSRYGYDYSAAGNLSGFDFNSWS